MTYKYTVDEYSTTRATWDVVVQQLIQESSYIIPDKVVASFMHYRDAYVFMKGLAVAQGIPFEEYQPDTMHLKSKNGDYQYKLIVRRIYVGKE